MFSGVKNGISEFWAQHRHSMYKEDEVGDNVTALQVLGMLWSCAGEPLGMHSDFGSEIACFRSWKRS